MAQIGRLPSSLFDRVLDVIGALVVFLDKDGRIARFNAACERATGYTEEEVLGREVWEFLIPAEEVEPVKAVFRDLRASGLPSQYTNDWITKQGEHRRIAWSNTVSAQSDGRVQFVVGTGIDITDRVATETALRTNRTLLQMMIATSPDAIITIDAAGIIESFNAAAEAMFGYSPNEVIGENVDILMPEPYRREHDGYIARYLETRENRIIGIGREVLGRRKDGTAFPIELAVGEVELGGRRRFTGFIRDITKRRQAEEESARSEQQLSEALERLHDLQSEFTHVSRLSAMGEMAATLAHELNQPLTAVMNYAQASRRMLQSADSPEAARVEELMSKTVDQAHRAGEIIRRLRSFVAHGETDRRREDVNEVVADACALALVGARAEGIDVVTTLDDDLPPVVMDRVQIQQVLVNLVRNSVDALQDQVERSVTVKTGREQGGGVRVSVADNGPGLDKAIADKLFQPFNTSKPDGMGIGLSVSRTIIEQHGGRIWATPGDGGGVTFSFILPIGA